jgi:helix-turn-helix protein
MFRIMKMPEFLQFTPVPVRAQHNGWTAGKQLRFILALARGAGLREAARELGMSRQSAYRLRQRPGAESFAAAWDRAQAFARDVTAASRSPASGFGCIETILVPRHYRGRLIGFVQREDTAGAMRVLRQLDRLADRLGDTTDLRAWSERLDAFVRLTGARSDRSDTNRQ